MVEFELIAKIRADYSKLMQDLRNMPKQIKEGMKAQIDLGADTKVGKDLVKANKALLGGLKKVAVGVAALGGALALYAKASPRLAAALGRLEKTILLFFRPFGDFISKFVNQISKWLRDIQKGRKEAVRELGPAKTTAAEIGGAAAVGVAGAVAGAKAGGALGARVGLIGGPKGALAGAVAGGLIGAGVGFFLGPQALRGVEEFVNNATKMLGDFVAKVRQMLAPILDPMLAAFEKAVGFINSVFINPIANAFSGFLKFVGGIWNSIAKELSELADVIFGIWNDIVGGITGFLTKAFNFFMNEFVAPIASGAADLASAILEKFNEWIEGVKEFIRPFVEWLSNTWETIVKEIKKIIKPIVKWMKDNVIGPLIGAWQNLAETVKGIWEGIKKTIEGVYNAVKPMIEFIKGGVSAAGKAVGGALHGAAKFIRGKKQVGGFVPETGFYYLHRGEYVQRAGEATKVITVNPTININVEKIESEPDWNRIYEEINRRMVEELRRLK